MDVGGAQALAARIEQHQHWRIAGAVRDGRQPELDPDAHVLEAIGDGFRVYGYEQTDEIVAGRRARVTRCRRKVLRGDRWEWSLDLHRVEFLAS